MANKLKVETQQAVIQLARQKWGIRQIARKLGISRNSVRSYIRACQADGAGLTASESPPPSSPSPPTEVQTDPLSTTGSSALTSQLDPLSTTGATGRKGLCAEHAGLILGKLDQGLSVQRIYQDLKVEIGFEGSYSSVKRCAGKLRQSHPELIHRIEVQPGEEAQVDFGAGPMLVDSQGRKRKTWIFRIILSYSRKGYSQAVLRQDTESFIRCLENAFRHFVGVPATLNLDNLKAAVIKANWADPDLNPKLSDFARHYGATILPCLPRTPEHKGKVEAGIKYIKNNALAGRRRFESLAQLNRWLAEWERTVADVRIHGTTKRQVAQLFAVEKASLIRLPHTLFPSFQEGKRSVHRDGHVEVEKAFYHVPPEYIGREVWARYDGREVRILIKNKEGWLDQIALHRRREPGEFTNARGIGGGHGTLQANLHYWLERASDLGGGCEQWAKAVARQRQIGALRTLMGLVSLSRRHAPSRLNRACEQAQARGAWRLRDIRALLDTKQTQTEMNFEEHHPLIRNLSEYGVFIRNPNRT